ncbi:hypothetical protein MLD38_036948 [Melastoma candidum]|uniref:Uncharacterized protein n=1 Tax=Melastoma candidum TaxID=119954 RepID=A0ACB9LLG8_9MYRT|nr:hypothetical protein MLD38_036948 [Melastoma candidum]
MDTKHAFEMIKISEGCSHSFCSSCVTTHVETKILTNVAGIKCPGLGCGSVIEVGICMGFLKRTLLERWERLRCEAAFAEPQKYYCPFKDCSGMLIVDGEAGDPVRLRECECPYCHRLFCASCRVPWHWKYTCEDFKSKNANDRGSNDVPLKELAQKRKWQRCPTCKFYVERTFGCPHIVCRCPTLLPTHLSYGSGCWKLRLPTLNPCRLMHV